MSGETPQDCSNCVTVDGGSGPPVDTWAWWMNGGWRSLVPSLFGGSDPVFTATGLAKADVPTVSASVSGTLSPAKTGACANSALSAAGVDIVDRIAKTNALLAADYDLAAKSNGQANGAVMALMTYYSLVHTGGPQDDKNHPGPGTQQQRIDAGNVSFGVTCPFGATFCQAAAGAAQAYSGLLNIVSFGKFGHGRPGPASTFFDSPSDNASIKVGQAMRAVGCS
jgi:hypothetical protein